MAGVVLPPSSRLWTMTVSRSVMTRKDTRLILDHNGGRGFKQDVALKGHQVDPVMRGFPCVKRITFSVESTPIGHEHS